MAYTDLQTRAFSRIAYMDLDKKFREKSVPAGTPVKLGDLLNADQKTELEKFGIKAEEFNSWEITATYDTNQETGFYACVIQTSPGNAAVAFRGSEDMGTYQRVKTDWVDADLRLVNSTLTTQHEEIRKFFAEYKDLLNGYGDLTMTGHSLGGNLAEYATIVSGEYGLDDNISRCVSNDGPGFSDEFIRKYQDEIQHMKDKMTHYRWSFVGTMLNDLPGVDYLYLSVSNEANNIDGVDFNMFTRHDMKYLDYDENTGMFIPGGQDPLSKVTSIISEGFDHLPPALGNFFVDVVGAVWTGIMWTKERMFDEDGNLTLAGYGVIAAAAALIPAVGIGSLVVGALEIIELAVFVLAFVAVYEIGHDLIMAAIEKICTSLEKIYKWGKDIVDKLREGLYSVMKKVSDWFKNIFSSGGNASGGNLIKVDTGKLTDYAGRLSRVNQRIFTIDKRMDSLYRKIGLLDLYSLLNLVSADIRTGYSYKLKCCENYLKNTANDFESVENTLKTSL